MVNEFENVIIDLYKLICKAFEVLHKCHITYKSNKTNKNTRDKIKSDYKTKHVTDEKSPANKLMALKPRGLVSACRSLHFGQKLSRSFRPPPVLETLQASSPSEVLTNEDALLCLSALTRLGRSVLPLVAALAKDTTLRNSKDLDLFCSAISGVSDRGIAKVMAEISSEKFPASDEVKLRLALHRLRRFDPEISCEKIPSALISELQVCAQLAALAETGELLSDRKFLGEILAKIQSIDPTMVEISMVLSAVHVGRVRSEISAWVLKHAEFFIEKFPIPTFALVTKFIGEEISRPARLEAEIFARLEKFPDELSVRELERCVFRFFDFRGRSEIFSTLIADKPLDGAGLGLICAAAESEISPPEISVPQVDFNTLSADFIARLVLAAPHVAVESEILCSKISDLSPVYLLRLCLAGKISAVPGPTLATKAALALGRRDVFRAKLVIIDLLDKNPSDPALRLLLAEVPDDGAFGIISIGRSLVG